MAEWRETPSGERQWLGGDGNWYSSEQSATAAGSPNFQPPVASLTEPTFPGIYQRPSAPSGKSNPKYSQRSVRTAILITLAVVVVIVVASIASGSGGSFKVDMVSAKILSAQQVQVSFRLHNVGGTSGTPNCTISVVPVFGGGIGTGTATTQDGNPVSAGQYAFMDSTIMVSDNDAAAVTNSDVTVTC